MTSITYKSLISRFYLKVEAYDLLELTKDMRNEFLCGYIHSVLSKPYLRRLFSSITINDPSVIEVDNPNYDPNMPESESNIPFIQEEVDGNITFELKHINTKKDDKEDEDFVLEVIACGIVLAWIEPKVNSLTHMRRMVGTADEKFFAESTFMTSLMNLYESSELRQRRLIGERGFIYNNYIEGKSSAAKRRSL